MVDTSDEWITTRVGIKERRILTEEGLGSSYMARKAAKQLVLKTGVDKDTIDCVIVATTTPDYRFPSNASIVIGKLGLKNAHGFDVSCACCGFLYTVDMAATFVESGRYKKVLVIMGVGYKAEMSGKNLVLSLGFANDIEGRLNKKASESLLYSLSLIFFILVYFSFAGDSILLEVHYD